MNSSLWTQPVRRYAMSEIQAAVHARYRQELKDMDRGSYEDLVMRRTAELEAQIAQRISETEHSMIRAWEKEMGRVADYTERMGLLNQARLSAQETVLHEALWEGYQAAEDNPTENDREPASPKSAMPAWAASESPASPEMERLAELVWPDQPIRWQLWAADLLQSRATESMNLPQGPHDQLATELERVVSAALAEHDALIARKPPPQQ